MAQLSIVFRGEDEVAGVTKQVADDIGDVEKASDSAKESGTGFFSGMLASASGFLVANVVGQITQQVGAFVSEGFSAARDTQQLMAQTETIIKNTGGAAGMSAQQVTDLATSLSDAAGQSLFGDDQIQGAENVLLKYKELKGIIPGVTQLSVDMAQSLGKDPAAAAEFLGRALQKPFDAANKLAKEGIVLTDSQKQTLEAFKKTGDTAGAQAFLMQQLNSTYAGSAKAAADAAGGTVQFKARMGEVAENLATAALPLLDKLGGLLNDYVAPVIEKVVGTLGQLISVFQDTGAGSTDFAMLIGDLASNFGLSADAVTNFVFDLQDSFAAFQEAGGLTDQLSAAVDTLATYWTDTLLPALDQVWQFIQDNVIPIINDLVQVAFAVLKEDIRILAALWVNVLWPALQKVWQFIQANILPILAQLIVWLKDNLPPVIRALAALWTNTLLPALTAVWQFIDTKVLPILRAIGDVVNAVIVVAIKLMAAVITNVVIPAFEKIYDYINKNVMPVLKTLGGVLSDTLTPAFSFLGTVIQPVVGYFADLLSNVQGVVDWLETLARKISSIHIPSWASGGGSSGGASGGESSGGGSTEAPPGTGGPITGQSAQRTASLRSLGGGLPPSGETTVRIVFDAGAMAKLITATVEQTLAQSGTSALRRIQTGN